MGGELCYVEFQQVVMFANSGFAQSRSGRCRLGWAGLDWRWRSGEYELWDVSGLLLGCWIDHFSVVSIDLVGYYRYYHNLSVLHFVKKKKGARNA